MKKQHLKHLSLLGLVLALGACGSLQGTFKPSMYEDTTITERPITVETTRFVEKKPAKDVDYSYLSSMVYDYQRHGSSQIYTLLTYNPDAKDAKLTAFNKSNVIKGQLAKLGVKDAVVKTMPVANASGDVIIGYDYMSAKGPENCGKMPGYGAEPGARGNYGLGCTLNDIIAKQTAYTADLAGQNSMSTFEAQRAGSPVTRDTRSGEISDFVPGYILSEIGG